METPIEKIESDKIYSLLSICNNKLVPHATSLPTLKKAIIKSEIPYVSCGTGSGKRYYVRGQALIKYLDEFYGTFQV